MRSKSQYLRPLMTRPVSGPYRPTTGVARWWFRTINREIFRDSLPMASISTSYTEPGAWACYWPGEIHLKRRFETKQHFVAVLAHEMVHHWQAVNRMGNHCHGPSFQRWKPCFRRHGIELEVHGDVHFD